MQRLRITFRRGEEIKYITHLDIMRLWQRALRRADLMLSYTKGFSPHLRLSLAAPLAVGVTSDCELMDMFMERRVSPHYLTKTLSGKLPGGIGIMEVFDIPLGSPSLQSRMLGAEYRVDLETDRTSADVEAAIGDLLAKPELPWQHARDKEIHKYDLRALVNDIWLLNWSPGQCSVGMRLRCDSGGTGRPEQVAAALGFSDYPRAIHRTRLILEKEALSRKQG